jgi:hypothetical protein
LAEAVRWPDVGDERLTQHAAPDGCPHWWPGRSPHSLACRVGPGSSWPGR